MTHTKQSPDFPGRFSPADSAPITALCMLPPAIPPAANPPATFAVACPAVVRPSDIDSPGAVITTIAQKLVRKALGTLAARDQQRLTEVLGKIVG